MDSLTAYIPMDRRQALALGETLPDRSEGCALFADIVGFAPFTESLVLEFGPERGIEELTIHLNHVYEDLIQRIHGYRGSVIGFVGDAITCWFDTDDGTRAAACALAMQRVMGSYSSIAMAGKSPVVITLKIGIAVGPVRRFRVGDPNVQFMDVLAGDTLRRMSLAEGQARKGEVLLDSFASANLSGRVTIAKRRRHPDANHTFAILSQLNERVVPDPWPDLTGDVILEHRARSWVLLSVYERLMMGQEQFLAELRPAVSLFQKFTGLDYDRDPSAGAKLDAYIRWVQRVLARYESDLIQLTIGDKGSFLYAAFGATVAHDDDAVRAVAAALELQDLPEAFDFVTSTQIGLAQGVARTGPYGSPSRRSYGVIGDDAVVAARLMGIAPANQIRCDFNTYRLANRHISFETLPAVRVKGKAGLIRVYRPNAGTFTASVPRRWDAHPAPMIGRERAVAHLEQLLDDVAEGMNRALLIEGEPGIGKSRLVEELVRLVRGRGLTELLGAGQSLEQQTPYRAWREVFNAFFDIEGVADTVERRRRVENVVSAIAPEWGQHLSILDDVLNLGFSDADMSRSLEPDLRQQYLFALLTRLLQSWSRERPLILVLEDAHWLDSLSWELTGHLARTLVAGEEPVYVGAQVVREMAFPMAPLNHSTAQMSRDAVPNPSVLLVLVMRSLGVPSNLAHHVSELKELPTTETLALGSLTPEQTGALVSARLGLSEGGLPATVADLVQERSGGNPLFAEELALALRDRGVIQVERGASKSDIGPPDDPIVSNELKQARQTLPHTVHGLVLARLGQMPPERQLILKVAAVIGRSFSYEVLRTVLKQHTAIDDAALRSHLDALALLDLTPVEATEPTRYRFKNAIIREVAYQTLLFGHRAQLHRSVAEALEGSRVQDVTGQLVLLAYHWERAQEPTRAIPYLLQAGEKAREAYANDEAVASFERVLTLLQKKGPQEVRRDWQLQAMRRLGQIFFGTGELAKAEAYFQAAIALHTQIDLPSRQRARLYFWLGETLFWENKPKELLEVGLEGMALLKRDTNLEITQSVEVALINQTLAVGHLANGEIDQFEELTFQTAQFLGHLPYSEVLRPAYAHVIIACRDSKRIDEALKWIHLLERKATVRYDLRALAEVHMFSAQILELQGRLQSAFARHKQALELFRQIGDVKHESWSLPVMANLLVSLGDLEQATAHAHEGLETAQAVSVTDHVRWSRQQLAKIDLCRGDGSAAIKQYEHVLEAEPDISHPLQEVWARYDLGRAFLAHGNRAAALKEFQRAFHLVSRKDLQPDAFQFAALLSGLEEAYEDDEAFHEFFQRHITAGVGDPTPKAMTAVQWFLEPALLSVILSSLQREENFDERLDAAWVWKDPLGDCSFLLQHGLIIRAANGRDLSDSNLSAPRLMRTVSGDFVLQTMCMPLSREQPAIGGLLVWKDYKNYLRLDRGVRGESEISFSGCLAGKELLIGRGRLPIQGAATRDLGVSSDRVWIRLEHIGDQVKALCSRRGECWLSVGTIAFFPDASVQIGLFAIGAIDRLIYPGAHLEGSAIRFESLEMG